MATVKPTLVVLAAGMGSRYGGLKQIDPMGPNGETMLDYSVNDAIAAGFTRVVFVIRRDFAEAFRSTIGHRFSGRIEVSDVFQEMDDLPEGFRVPEGREKPWGTAHAVRAARHVVDGPFAVINADDFYGRDAYFRAVSFLTTPLTANHSVEMAMVGYPLENTLSEHGHVNRGICQLDPHDCLAGVEEYVGITRDADGVIRGNGLDGERRPLTEKTLVSMNFWAFAPGFFEALDQSFTAFLRNHGSRLKSECYIPTVVDELVRSGSGRCRVLRTSAHWFGVTYPADKPIVVDALRALTARGDYPSLSS